MGSTTTTELGLDLRRPSKALNSFLRKLDAVKGGISRLDMIEEHLRCLEEERKKIDVFKRELPLCMFILTDAPSVLIEELKEELIQCRDEASNYSPPVLEQFLPIDQSKMEEDGVVVKPDYGDKIDWMSSVQLWSDNYSSSSKASPHSNSNNNPGSGTKTSATDEQRGGDQDRQSDCCGTNPFAVAEIQLKSTSGGGGGAFSPSFKGHFDSPSAQDERNDKNETTSSLLPDLSLFTPGIKGSSSHLSESEEQRSCGSISSSKDKFFASTTNNAESDIPQQQQQQQTAHRKARRCWSPELHRRFVSALQHLGGSQAATPKQIRELMKVDGLTNDEVKSHLQKYRLHTRRLTPPALSGQANHQHMVVLGGLWGVTPPNDQYKPSTPSSGSPKGPLQLAAGTTLGASITGGDSCEEQEEEEDSKSENYCWKGHTQQRSSEEETI